MQANIDTVPHTSSNSTPVALSFEQERCLKQQLLKVAIQDEVDLFCQSAKSIETSLFLKFMKEKILEFPLWSRKDKAQAKTLELIMTLPELCKQAQKATKRDKNNKAVRLIVAKAMGLTLRTPLEHSHDATEAEAAERKWEAKILETEQSAAPEEAKLARSHKKISELFRTLLAEAGQQEGGYSHLFRVVKSTEKLTDLPPLYQVIATEMAQASALYIESTLQDEKQLSKLKKIQLLTPIKGIRAALAVSNPVTLMKGLLSLFMARPFGARNLIQKFTEILVETKKSESLFKDAQKVVENNLKPSSQLFRKSVPRKVSHYVKQNAEVLRPNVEFHDDDTPTDDDEEERPALVDQLTPRELVMRILKDDTVLPVLEADQIANLTDAAIISIYEMAMAELRVNEKESFIEFMGNEQLLSIVRELLPVIHEPIASLFKRASVGKHFETLFKTVNRIIKVAEMKQHPASTRIRMYEIVMNQFFDELYDFVHNIAASDDSTLDNTIKWLLKLMDFMNKEEIPVQTLLTDLPVGQYDQIVHELDDVLEYRRLIREMEEAEKAETLNAPAVPEGKEAPAPKPKLAKPPKPSTATISKLVPSFVPLADQLIQKARNM